ncbi:MAG: hypothetical protein JNK78_19185 [Planctomycetes bacterium]|nr:hypothetical protein [Planctomycetota bacterium]
MNRLLATVVVLAATSTVRAQDPPATSESRDQVRAEERARSMREQIDTGKQVKSHVRVAVRLKNGNKLVGVVKDGRFVERVDGLRFVDAQANDRGAGIRLWYTSGIRNYVFVPFADFVDYQVLQRLSTKQLEELESEMQLQEGRRAERQAADARAADAAKARAEGEATGDAVTPPAEGEATPPGTDEATKTTAGKTKKAKAGDTKPEGEGAKGETAQQRQWFALLQAYPPAGGWNKAKRDEIAKRFVVIGAKPSETEQKFVDQFAEWEKACSFFGVTETKEAGAAPAGETQTESTGRKSRRK